MGLFLTPTPTTPLAVIRLPEVDYGEALQLQRELLEARLLGDRPDTLILLAHPPVVTVGRGSHAENMRLSEEELRGRGIALWETDRGGDVTYHGPNQVVGYVIFDLRDHGQDLHRFLRQIEGGVLRALGTFGVEGRRIPGLTGVWVGERKVCAIGIKVSRWISMHGFALNVDDDLSGFEAIVPCGIQDRGVTSLQGLLGREVERRQVEDALIAGFAAEFGITPREDRLARDDEDRVSRQEDIVPAAETDLSPRAHRRLSEDDLNHTRLVTEPVP
jgi:lipoyl(octanoyl) transferase